MFTTNSIFKKIIKYAAYLILILIILSSVYITLLAYPEIYVSNKIESEHVILYYDDFSLDELRLVLNETELRITKNRFFDQDKKYRIFYIKNVPTYHRITKMSGVTPKAQGFNLSIFGNSFVCDSIAKAKSNLSYPHPPYSIWEGNPAHTIAHEFGHEYIADKLGRSVWAKIPHWKQEGLPEYFANNSFFHNDSSHSLKNRIDILLDDKQWNYTYDWDRIHYEAALLVEYLLDIEQLALEQIVDPAVSKEAAYKAMLEYAQSSDNL